MTIDSQKQKVWEVVVLEVTQGRLNHKNFEGLTLRPMSSAKFSVLLYTRGCINGKSGEGVQRTMISNICNNAYANLLDTIFASFAFFGDKLQSTSLTTIHLGVLFNFSMIEIFWWTKIIEPRVSAFCPTLLMKLKILISLINTKSREEYLTN